MERRAFLNLAGAISAATLIPSTALADIAPLSALPVQAVAQGKLFRGSDDGKILVSTNAGESWALHADFGSGYAVQDLSQDPRGVLRARLSGADARFELALNAKGNAWVTG
jgi:hypothetical protein